MSTSQVAFRLDDALIARIDAYARHLANRTPGIEYTRADAARALLARALDMVETEYGGTPPAEHPAKPKTRKRGA